MKTITLFGKKGGSGRTITTMALASGFLAQGKRVAVMECTYLANSLEHPYPLRKWMVQMVTQGLGTPRLELIVCTSGQEVEDAVASTRTRGIDILLIDTSAVTQEPQFTALGLADLIIAPAISRIEATGSVEGLDKYLDTSDHALGLINGCRLGASEASEIRRAFKNYSVMQTELPCSEVLSEQIVHGDIGLFVSSLCSEPEFPGYARFRAAQNVWSAVQRLCFEVEWALNGKRLEGVTSEEDP